MEKHELKALSHYVSDNLIHIIKILSNIEDVCIEDNIKKPTETLYLINNVMLINN